MNLGWKDIAVILSAFAAPAAVLVLTFFVDSTPPSAREQISEHGCVLEKARVARRGVVVQYNPRASTSVVSELRAWANGDARSVSVETSAVPTSFVVIARNVEMSCRSVVPHALSIFYDYYGRSALRNSA